MALDTERARKLAVASIVLAACLFSFIAGVQVGERNAYGIYDVLTDQDIKDYGERRSLNSRRRLLGGTVKFLGGMLTLTDYPSSSMTVAGSVSATSITDGTMTISGGTITGGTGSMTTSGTVQGNIVTDGTASLNGGALTNVDSLTLSSGAISGATTITGSGQIQGGTLTDTTATLTGGALTGLKSLTLTTDNGASAAISDAATITATGQIQGGTFTDNTATLTGGALTGLKSLTLTTDNGASAAISDAATITATGAITGGSLTDGHATISSGALSGVTSISASSGITISDGVNSGSGWGLSANAFPTALSADTTLSMATYNGKFVRVTAAAILTVTSSETGIVFVIVPSSFTGDLKIRCSTTNKLMGTLMITDSDTSSSDASVASSGSTDATITDPQAGSRIQVILDATNCYISGQVLTNSGSVAFS